MSHHVARWQRSSASPDRSLALSSSRMVDAEGAVATSSAMRSAAEQQHKRFCRQMRELSTAMAVLAAKAHYGGRRGGQQQNMSREGSLVGGGADALNGSMASSCLVGAWAMPGGEDGEVEEDAGSNDVGGGGGGSGVYRTISKSSALSIASNAFGGGYPHHMASARAGSAGSSRANSARGPHHVPSSHPRGGGGSGFYVSTARNPLERDERNNYHPKMPQHYQQQQQQQSAGMATGPQRRAGSIAGSSVNSGRRGSSTGSNASQSHRAYADAECASSSRDGSPVLSLRPSLAKHVQFTRRASAPMPTPLHTANATATATSTVSMNNSSVRDGSTDTAVSALTAQTHDDAPLLPTHSLMAPSLMAAPSQQQQQGDGSKGANSAAVSRANSGSTRKAPLARGTTSGSVGGPPKLATAQRASAAAAAALAHLNDLGYSRRAAPSAAARRVGTENVPSSQGAAAVGQQRKISLSTATTYTTARTTSSATADATSADAISLLSSAASTPGAGPAKPSSSSSSYLLSSKRAGSFRRGAAGANAAVSKVLGIAAAGPIVLDSDDDDDDVWLP